MRLAVQHQIACRDDFAVGAVAEPDRTSAAGEHTSGRNGPLTCTDSVSPGSGRVTTGRCLPWSSEVEAWAACCDSGTFISVAPTAANGMVRFDKRHKQRHRAEQALAIDLVDTPSLVNHVCAPSSAGFRFGEDELDSHAVLRESGRVEALVHPPQQQRGVRVRRGGRGEAPAYGPGAEGMDEVPQIGTGGGEPVAAVGRAGPTLDDAVAGLSVDSGAGDRCLPHPGVRNRARARLDNVCRVNRSGYRQYLRSVVATSAGPHGYTLTIFTTGSVTIHSEGVPSAAEAILLLAGAAAAFGLVGASAFGGLSRALGPVAGAEVLLYGALHLPSVGLAILACALLGVALDGLVLWTLVGVVGTGTFLVLHAAQLLLVARLSPGPGPLEAGP